MARDQLTEDPAGKLFNQINAIKKVLKEITESEIDEIIAGTYFSTEGGIEEDTDDRVTSEEIAGIVDGAFGGAS